MHFRNLLFVTAATLLLAACNNGQPPVAGLTVEGQVANPSEVPRPNFLSLVAVHPDQFALPPEAIRSLAVDYDGLLAVASSPVAEDGSFEWEFGDGSSIPVAYMAPASKAFQSPDADTTCEATASTPVSVLRSFVDQEGLFTPLAMLGPLTEQASHGEGLVLYSDIDLAGGGDSFKLKTWLYADGDVSIVGECVNDNGADPAKVVITIDVELDEGWNEVYVDVDHITGTASVSNEPFDGTWRYYEGFF